MGGLISRHARGASSNRTDADPAPMDTGHDQERSILFLTDFKCLVMEALHKDLCLGEEMQALVAEVAKAELAWQQDFDRQAQERADLHAAKDDTLQQLNQAQQRLKSCEENISDMKEKSQREAEWHKVQPRNQHTKQLQDKFSGLNSKIHQLTEDLNSEQRHNASLTAKINEVQTARHELSQSLQHEQASHAKSEEQRQYAQNSLSMRTEALASKERQLSQVLQVNKPVLNYLDATDTLEADTSTSIMKTIYTKQIQAPAKILFKDLKEDHVSLLHKIFLHNNAVADSSEVNKSVVGSILRLFLSKVNIELDRAVWGLHTNLDAGFKPFASKQQVLFDIQGLVGQQRPEDLQNDVKVMVNRYLGLHRELCKFWGDKADPVTAVPVQTMIGVVDGLCHSIFGPLSKEAINQLKLCLG